MRARYGLPWLGFACIWAAAATVLGGESPCQRNADLEAWLAAKAETWTARLAEIPGYERPGPLSVCRASGGGPRSEGAHIYLPPLRGEEELVSLTHEYVHLAFRHHPRTRDEGFVERTARALLGEEQ